MKFKTQILQIGNNTGIGISEAILEKLGGGLKPLVVITINGYSYRGAVGKMGGKFMISLSADNRNKAGVKGGDNVEIILEIDKEPRVTALPADLVNALDKIKAIKEKFEKLAQSKKKAMVLFIEDAKTPETRLRRINKVIESLQ